MFKSILFLLALPLYIFNVTQDSAKFNDFEPVHIFAAIKFPINQISSQDIFTQEIFKDIDTTFGPQGINLDAYQMEHVKKTYLYLIFLTKLEKVKNDEKFKQYQNDFSEFLQDNGQSQPYIPTAKLLNSNGWLQVKIDSQDIASSTMWQLFCKSMITDINAYLIIGLKLIHNCEKEEFNYIPHFETSYYNQDYVQIRNINSVVRVKIALEQQVQKRYLNVCTDWNKLLNSAPKSSTKSSPTIKLETQIVLFQKTEFYQKTHNMHNLMGTQSKFNAHQKITHEDLLSAPAIASPLKEYVFGFFLLYELYGQITSFMHEKNLDQVLTMGSSSTLAPNIFPYTQNDFILISELLAGKNIIQDKPTNSVHPTIKTFKPEDLRDVKDWINPTRKPTDQYLKQQLASQKTVQAQSFLSFFSDVGHDIVQAADDIKHSVEKAADAVKNFGESVGKGIAGFVLTTVGNTSEGSKLSAQASQEFTQATQNLETSIDDYEDSIKEGIIAPIGELTGDVIGFITDDKKIGADTDAIITNCEDVLINMVQQVLNTAAVSLIYIYTLPEQTIAVLIQTMVAAVLATWNQQAALDICHSILRSLVTTFMMVAQVSKGDFHVMMSALGTFMNATTTLFNDLIREITVIVATGFIGLVTNIANAAGANIKTFDYANKAADTAYNTLNEHRAIINQALGVAVMIGADIVTGGAATAGDVAIDAALEDSLTETTSEAQEAVSTAEDNVTTAQEKLDDADSPQAKAQAKDELDDAKAKLKAAKDERDTILKQVKETKSQAQDAAGQAKEERDATTLLKKTKLKISRFFRAYKSFLGKNKDIVTGAKDIASDDISGLAKSLQEPTENVMDGLAGIGAKASRFIARIKSIPDDVSSFLEDGRNFLSRNTVAATEKSAKALSAKIDDLTTAQKEFNQALDDYKIAAKTSTKNLEEFAKQQKNLFNATKKLRQAEIDFEKAAQDSEKNFKNLSDEEKDLVNNPLKNMKENAEEDVEAAENNLATENEVGNYDSIQNAEKGLRDAKKQLKIINDAINSVPDVAKSIPVRQQILEKLDDALEYIKSKGKSFKNLLKNNKGLEKQEDVLSDLNAELEKQEADLKTAQESKDQSAINRAQKDIDDTKSKITKQEKKALRAREYARDQEASAKETAKSKALRYMKNAFSPIGIFMNIAFNFTSIIGGYNQDEKNLLQQQQQEKNVQNLWNANTQSKISTSHINLAYLDEIAEKQKASIGNQVLGLSLSSNYSYANLENFEKIVQQTLAILYTLQLYPNAMNGLIPANIGSNWGLISNYLNLYPSEGFYVTTTGRPDFPYSQEIAQAPKLLTQTSKTKTKQWFNQRCTGIDSKHKNGILKQPSDPILVDIDFKFLYTLDSEFYVGIYMGGSYHDYFAKTYLAALLGTTVDNLAQAYAKVQTALQAYGFNLNLIDINETYLAKMIVLYRKSATDQLRIGIYEQNLTNKEWLLDEILPVNMQFDNNHSYNLQAKLDKTTLQITLCADNNPQTNISKTVSVAPISNQRMYGIIASSAAIEWDQTAPIVDTQVASNIRKPSNLTLEKERNKTNKLVLEEAINQNFGGKTLTLISKNRARIFGQYIYASVQTDIEKINPKNPADFLVFATNNNGDIINIGKASNSFKDSKTNVLVSLITGHVFDNEWNCISTIANVWTAYSSSEYGPFLTTLQETIKKQQQEIFKKLELIQFGPFKLDAINIQALENGAYLYTCMQTLTDASGKPFTDYAVFAPTIAPNQPNIILGLTPSAPNATTMVSLITGNSYEKNTVLAKGVLPVPIATLNIIDISTYLKQNLSAYSSIIFNQTQQYQTQEQQKQIKQQSSNTIQSATSNGSLAVKKDLFPPGKTFHLKFNFSKFNFADRQRQAAGDYKMQLNPAVKVLPK